METQRTDVVPRNLDGQLGNLPRFRSLHLALRSLLYHRTFQRLANHGPHRIGDVRRVPFSNRIPQLRVLVQPLTRLVQPEVCVADLERHLMKEAEEDVCCCGVEGGGSNGVGAGEGEEGGEKGRGV